MFCRFEKKRYSHKNCIWLILLMLFLETAVLSARMQMATFLPRGVERQTTHASIRNVRTGTPVAALSSAARDAEAICRAAAREQRIDQRRVSGCGIFICAMSLLCLLRLLRRLRYRLSVTKSYRRSHFMISYIYNLTHL